MSARKRDNNCPLEAVMSILLLCASQSVCVCIYLLQKLKLSRRISIRCFQESHSNIFLTVKHARPETMSRYMDTVKKDFNILEVVDAKLHRPGIYEIQTESGEGIKHVQTYVDDEFGDCIYVDAALTMRQAWLMREAGLKTEVDVPNWTPADDVELQPCLAAVKGRTAVKKREIRDPRKSNNWQVSNQAYEFVDSKQKPLSVPNKVSLRPVARNPDSKNYVYRIQLDKDEIKDFKSTQNYKPIDLDSRISEARTTKLNERRKLRQQMDKEAALKGGTHTSESAGSDRYTADEVMKHLDPNVADQITLHCVKSGMICACQNHKPKRKKGKNVPEDGDEYRTCNHIHTWVGNVLNDQTTENDIGFSWIDLCALPDKAERHADGSVKTPGMQIMKQQLLQFCTASNVRDVFKPMRKKRSHGQTNQLPQQMRWSESYINRKVTTTLPVTAWNLPRLIECDIEDRVTYRTVTIRAELLYMDDPFHCADIISHPSYEGRIARACEFVRIVSISCASSALEQYVDTVISRLSSAYQILKDGYLDTCQNVDPWLQWRDVQTGATISQLASVGAFANRISYRVNARQLQFDDELSFRDYHASLCHVECTYTCFANSRNPGTDNVDCGHLDINLLRDYHASAKRLLQLKKKVDGKTDRQSVKQLLEQDNICDFIRPLCPLWFHTNQAEASSVPGFVASQVREEQDIDDESILRIGHLGPDEAALNIPEYPRQHKVAHSWHDMVDEDHAFQCIIGMTPKIELQRMAVPKHEYCDWFRTKWATNSMGENIRKSRIVDLHRDQFPEEYSLEIVRFDTDHEMLLDQTPDNGP